MSKQTRKDRNNARKLRIAIIDDESHGELTSFKTTRSQIITILSAIAVFLIVGTYLLTAFTGLKRTIPGYPSTETKMLALDNLRRIDSLENVIDIWAMQVANIQRVATGREAIPMDSLSVSIKNSDSLDAATLAKYARNDSLLREQVGKEEQFNISFKKNVVTQIEGLHFYTPVKGVITEEYNKGAGHPFIDIAAPENSSVCAILDGTVISAVWNDETGYTIQLQHSNDIVSVYKHNGKLLKKTGDHVSAGTPIALVGSTGTLSTGAHLHFELWHKGEAIDPALYISF